MELRRAVVTLSEIVNSAVETARPAIEEAGHELTITLPAQSIRLDADLTRLSQVISNLLTNSAKYTERRGRIWLDARPLSDSIQISVRDTGIGIPKSALPSIFDMFSQVDRPMERNSGGLGIGLALVKGLVEMHGGSVMAKSDGQGCGSEFVVTLPVLKGAGSDHSLPEESAMVTGSKRRVLVVDDNRDGAESMAMMLSLLGNEVSTAFDGLEAVTISETFRPEVILMDVGMPRLNGLDATRRIREQAWGKEIVIVALTGWGQENDRERSNDAGCNAHLVKPVDLAHLQELLQELKE
jgi:CheY-like chemotaxis protein